MIMSKGSDLEEGVARQDSGDAKKGTNSGVENSGNLIYLMLCVAAIFLDPLFFYIPVINDDKKCLRLDKKLGIAASIIRSVFDFFCIFYVICKSRTRSSMENGKKFAGKYFLHFFLIDLLAILPLPQVVILIMIAVRGSKFLDAMGLLKFFEFFQFVPRVIRIYPLFTEVPWSFSKLAEATWVKAAFNFLLYLLASHGFGALWYFFSIERETECWKNACRKHTRTGCNHGSFYCNDISGNYSFLNNFCPIKPQNATLFDFGIFHASLESGIVEVTDFPEKLIKCFFWGLQSLSCFGQNLDTSTNSWEGLFAILITISGLLLFILLIGNVQIFLQSKTIRSEEMRLKVQEIEQWTPFQKLPEDLRKEVKKYQSYIWRKTKGVDVENLLRNLPKDLRIKIKRKLCLDLLKKVEEFKSLDDGKLDKLCDCVKPAFFNERAQIVRENNPIDEMLFVVQGELWTYKVRAPGSEKDNYVGDNANEKEYLKDGDFCGQELVAWVKNNASSSNLPLSTRNILARTEVEAFALTADDLKKVYSMHQEPTSEQLDSKAASSELDSKAASSEKKKWAFLAIAGAVGGAIVSGATYVFTGGGRKKRSVT